MADHSMKHHISVALLVFFSCFALPPLHHAYALSCVRIKDLVPTSDNIFSGTVTNYDRVFSDGKVRVAIISVDTVWKGDIGKTVWVREPTTSIGWERPLEKGKRYIFAVKHAEIFQSGLCNTWPIPTDEAYANYTDDLGQGRSPSESVFPPDATMIAPTAQSKSLFNRTLAVSFLVILTGMASWFVIKRRRASKTWKKK